MMTHICDLPSEMLTMTDALDNIKNHIVAVEGDENIVLSQALGRVLSQSICSAINLPPHRNSAVDGYAFRSQDLHRGQVFSLTRVGTSWAGCPFKEELKAGECVRILTGAVVPEAADSVIMQEFVMVSGNKIHFPSDCRPRLNVREIGEDIQQQAELLTAGKKLTATDLALLAAAGIEQVRVKRRIKIGFFSTGDELVPLGQPLTTGQIYDSNRYALIGLLTDPSFELLDKGIITDDKTLLQQTLIELAAECDAIITTGSVSVGDADYIEEILEQTGQIYFWKVAIKPGKPLIFGKIGHCFFFGLPGNPVAVITTFDKIVKLGLRQLSGCHQFSKPFRIKAVCNSVLKKSPGRQDYQRGLLYQQFDGTLVVES
ncbi:MAG: hypothetical protein RL637_1805, partial [Pseudomonadota bacterium]